MSPSPVTVPAPSPAAPRLREVLSEIQARGVRVDEVLGQSRSGGAGPADAGMMWVEGIPVTFPHVSGFVAASSLSLRQDAGGWGLYRDAERLAGVTLPPPPKFYELSTADGIPYGKIALLHLDSLASTVIQTCAYWGNRDQCRFCGIELSLQAGGTIAVKKPGQLAEVALAARDLDGAVDVTLTTGSTRGPDRGALYLAQCAEAVKAATGMPVQGQFEPPEDHLMFHCANRWPVCGVVVSGDGCAGGGDLVHGDESFVGEPDLVDEGLDRGLAFDGVAVGGEKLVQVAGQVVQGGRGRGDWLGGDGVGELAVPGAELGELGGELGEAGSGGGVVHGAVLERGVVPADRRFFGGDLREQGVGFGLAGVVASVVVGLGAGDDVHEHAGFLGVEPGQRGQDGGVGFGGVDAGGGA